jgi:hypothetical protein
VDFNNRANRNALIFGFLPEDRRNTFRHLKRTAGIGENDFAAARRRPKNCGARSDNGVH